jgi:hypothetical protein
MKTSLEKIDKIFAEKLDNHEITPREQAWEKLQNKLNQNKDSKKAIPLWRRHAIAASVATILMVGIKSYFSKEVKQIENQPIEITSNGKRSSASSPNKFIEPISKAPTIKLIVQKEQAKGQKVKNSELIGYNKMPEKELISANFEAQDPSVLKGFENQISQINPDEIIVEKSIETVQNIKDIQSNNQEKPEELTILFTVANFENTKIIENQAVNNMENEKKKYLPKLFKQLLNAKNGDKVNWNELGFKPSKILARAENKFKSTKKEIDDSYQTVKNKTIF